MKKNNEVSGVMSQAIGSRWNNKLLRCLNRNGKSFVIRCLGVKGNSMLVEKSNGDIELTSLDKFINISILEPKVPEVVDKQGVE